jgi:hypothetical protein
MHFQTPAPLLKVPKAAPAFYRQRAYALRRGGKRLWADAARKYLMECQTRKVPRGCGAKMMSRG